MSPAWAAWQWHRAAGTSPGQHRGMPWPQPVPVSTRGSCFMTASPTLCLLREIYRALRGRRSQRLGVLQPCKRAESVRRCDACPPPCRAVPAPALWVSRGGLSVVASPCRAQGKQQLGLCRAVVRSRWPGRIPPNSRRFPG